MAQLKIIFVYTLISLLILPSEGQSLESSPTKSTNATHPSDSKTENTTHDLEAIGLDQTQFIDKANASYQKNDKIMALVYFEKALKMSPHSTALKNNIAVIQSELDVTSHQRMPILMNVLNISGIFAPNTWAILTLVSLAAILAYIVWTYPWRAWNGRNNQIIISLCILFIINIIFSYYRYLQVYKNEGIIITQNTFLFEAPDAISPQIIDLPSGTKVYYDETLGDFYKVKTDENLIGWIPKSHSIQI